LKQAQPENTMTDFLECVVQNEQETAQLAAKLGPLLRPSDILSLSGTLGAGKTAFARALIRALIGQEIEVPSPTFNLLLLYDTPAGTVYHYDFYRLEDPEEVWELDIEQAYEDGITVMEWAEKLEDLAPDDVLKVDITIPSDAAEDTRVFRFSGSKNWIERLETLSL
jgi:tRNA threonylcarbamoyl adenosine modification protein YjeE